MTETIYRKSPLMMGTFLGLWVASLVFFGPRLWQVIGAGKNLIEVFLLAGYATILIFFWLLATYYVSVLLFSFIAKPLPLLSEVRKTHMPQVAILYPTCNDFQWQAAVSCLSQEYPNYHLFLLDDSTKDEYRAMVDVFHATYPERTTIVRRPTRQGFKAGNLNHALRGAAVGYSFFAVIDADEILPPAFLQQTMAYMQYSKIAFVQANHMPNPSQGSNFSRDLGPTIIPFWQVHCRPRNSFGFVPFMGHGAMVRRAAWEAVGGFPEVVTEDLAFSAALAEKGLRGIFLEDLICYEDFPGSYTAFKRQQERYLIGTTQVIIQHFRSLLLSRQVSTVEKLDFFLWCSPLYVPVLVLLFLVLGSIALPVVFGHWETPSFSILGLKLALPALRVLNEPFRVLSSWDFQIFAALCALAPAFASLTLGFSGKLKATRLLFLSTVPYLSLMVVAWRGLLLYLFTRRVLWPPTGESLNETNDKQCKKITIATHIKAPSRVIWRAPIEWELILGTLLSVASLISLNLAFSVVSGCLLMGVGIQVFGWENRLVRLASVSCLAVILLQILVNLVYPFQALGPIPLVFSIHF